MKVIAECKHSTCADAVIATSLPRITAQELAHAYNQSGGPFPEKHYRAVEDDYVLREAP